MIVNKVELAAVGVKMSQYPTDDKTEIAFAGKSNVGKSSLINTLIGRKSLARISSQPGKTRTINFYDIENKLYFVDMPGYGYAKANKEEIKRWSKMVEDYLYKRPQLKSIIMLVDIRHAPGENDILMYDFLCYYGHKIIIAATKADKIKRTQKDKCLNILKNTLNLNSGDLLIPFSSVTKEGKSELWAAIESLLP